MAHRELPYRELPPPADMPAVFHDWLDWLTVYEDKPATTIRAYNQGVRRAVFYAGVRPSGFGPATLGQAQLIDAIREIRVGGGVSKATVSQTMAALKSFFAFCVEKGYLDTAPDIGRIRKLTRISPPQADPQYFRPVQIRALYAAATDDADGSRVRWPVRDLAMCSFLAVLGLRASELTAADLGWLTRERLVDADDRATWMLHVEGKGGRIRRLPLSPELVDANSRWQDERKERFGPSRLEEPGDQAVRHLRGERAPTRRIDRPGRGCRGRHQVRRQPEPHGRLHLQHRLCAGRSGRAADQPHAV